MLRDIEQSLLIGRSVQQEIEDPQANQWLNMPLGRFVDRFTSIRRPNLPKSLALRLSGALAIGVLGTTACGPSEDNSPLVSSASIVDQFSTNESSAFGIGESPQFQEVADWFNDLDTKQKAAVFMYGLMGLYFARFLARGTRAAIDPRGDLKLREREGLGAFIRNFSEVKPEDRLDAVRNSIVKDPQNTRSAIGISGFLTASIVHFVDGGNIGNLDVNTNILIVSLFAALLPSFKAFDRYKEKMHLEIIQKTAASVAGSFLGINEAGIYFQADDITFLQLFISGLAFGVLFAYGDMGTGSRDFVSGVFDGLKMDESLRRYDAFLKNRRLSHQARVFEESLMDGRMDEITKEGGLLDQSLVLVKKSLEEDGIDPNALAIALTEWRKSVERGVMDFKDLVLMGEAGESDPNSKRKRRGARTPFTRR